MHRPTRAALAVLALGSLAACSEQSTPLAPPATLQPAVAGEGSVGVDRYVVTFKNKIPSGFAATVAGLGGSVTVAYDAVGVAVVSGIGESGAAALAASSGVDQVGADVEIQFIDPPATIETESATDVIASPANPATAFFFPRQWHLRQINADDAWAAGQLGSPAVSVAILDTGIDYLHADLVGRVDLSRSASFVPSDDALVAAFFPSRHPVTDLHYHGTHVGATVSSNALAAAGVTSMTTLIGVKVLNVNGSGTTSAILAGIVHAADVGADIINMSLGNRNPPFDLKEKEIKDFFNKVVDRAFKYAHSKGVTVVVSAGNESQNLDVPQTYKPYCGAKHTICVSATGPTAQASVNGPWTNPDAFASYSNYGLKKIDVAAPGGNASAVWAACSTSSLQIPVCRTGTFVVGLAGTSMAAPHVSGLAALLRANQNGTALGNIRSTIENTAVDLGAPGEDPYYGRGRIDVAAALGI